jgi:hypothetical protein
VFVWFRSRLVFTTPLPMGDLQQGLNPLSVAGASERDGGDTHTGQEEEEGEEEEELTVLGNQLRLVGRLLSTPSTGAPTLLYKCLFAAAVGYPLWGMNGAGGIGFSPIASLMDGDWQGALPVLGIALATLLGAPAALHALRLATRLPDGFLAQLGTSTVPVQRRSFNRLRHWACFLATSAAFSSLIILLGMAAWIVPLRFGGLGLPILPMLAYAFHQMIFMVVGCLWYYSLKMASLLADVAIMEATHKVRTELARLRESCDGIDDERWRTQVEQPVRHLARHVLPTLSDGWGLSVGLAGGSLVGMVLSSLAAGLQETVGGSGQSTFDLSLFLGLLVAAPMPFLIVLEPATASSKCAKLEDEINAICNEDPGFLRADGFIKSLKRLNKDQGLG